MPTPVLVSYYPIYCAWSAVLMRLYDSVTEWAEGTSWVERYAWFDTFVTSSRLVDCLLLSNRP